MTDAATLPAADASFQDTLDASLRDFRVELIEGRVIYLSAHFHDAGAALNGHLNFVAIRPDGGQYIVRSINGQSWETLTDVTPQERLDRFAQLLRLEQAIIAAEAAKPKSTLRLVKSKVTH